MLNKIHAYLGLVLVLPLFVWAVTGLVFLIKPGYDNAFETLSIAKSSYVNPIQLRPHAHWQKLSFVQSNLGAHLLVTTSQGQNLHLHPSTLLPFPLPNEHQLSQLYTAATQHNRSRYGEFKSFETNETQIQILTTTGIELLLDWSTLRLTQRGKDTQLIDRLYRMHYLQWSPNIKMNMAIAFLAIVGLLIMCFVGLRLLIRFHHREQL